MRLFTGGHTLRSRGLSLLRLEYVLRAGIVALGIALPWSAQAQTVPQKPAATPAPKPAVPAKPAPCCASGAHKPAAPKVMARKGPPRGPIEKYDCKIGTEDQHARMALLAQGGEVQSVAYYGKWKPRTCSVHLQRGDAYSKWNDNGDATVINTEFGDFLIQRSKTEYQLFFREVDRMHYCGMMGKLNGSMTVTRGPKRQCSVEGVMERNESEPLDAERAAAPAADVPPPIATITPPGSSLSANSPAANSR
jgi:hypothetical protein